METGKIPVDYDYKGIYYKGILTNVSGSGNIQFYHLYVDSYYKGQLQLLDRGWQFSNQDGYQPDLADYFEAVLVSLYE